MLSWAALRCAGAIVLAVLVGCAAARASSVARTLGCASPMLNPAQPAHNNLSVSQPPYCSTPPCGQPRRKPQFVSAYAHSLGRRCPASRPCSSAVPRPRRHPSSAAHRRTTATLHEGRDAPPMPHCAGMSSCCLLRLSTSPCNYRLFYGYAHPWLCGRASVVPTASPRGPAAAAGLARRPGP